MNLRDAVPLEAVADRFPHIREDVRATTVPEFLANRANQAPSVCMFIWDEMVHRGLAQEPYKIAPIINNDYHGIYEFIRDELGEEPIKEIYSASFFNDVDDATSFIDVTLAHCFPNDIHIIDVEFSDNRHPLPARQAQAQMRGYRGLHVLGLFVDRLKRIALEKGAKRISLVCGAPGLYEVFRRHGFLVSDTEFAKRAFEQAGVGFPMIMHVKG